MKQSFRAKAGISKKNLIKLTTINEILDSYRAQGLRLTLRQLYYQMVARDIIPNTKAEYKKVMNLCGKGRMGGLIDWDSIEDRLRRPRLPYWADSVWDALDDTARQYRVNRQEDQEINVEVWLEKEALSAIVGRVCSRYHVRLMVNRGYSSITAMFDAFNRFKPHSHNVILYMGDHDPSGLDMIRDCDDRVSEFNQDQFTLEVKHIALTMDQVELHSPPPNFAKATDSRAGGYNETFGTECWEIDALEPSDLTEIVTDAIEAEIDLVKYEERLEVESNDKLNLRRIADNYSLVLEALEDAGV
ncbi:MAG: hypothetical protein JKY75_05530 [Erythrobacter sp.]|jgi:hypothetical protein|nr:hypothetical protein [Erythrobacter sp.]